MTNQDDGTDWAKAGEHLRIHTGLGLNKIGPERNRWTNCTMCGEGGCKWVTWGQSFALY